MWCFPYRLGGDIFHPESHRIPDYKYPEIQLKVIQPFSHLTFYKKALPQGPHSHILMMGEGEGGSNDFIDSEMLTKNDFLGLWKTPGFFWVARKTNGYFGVAKKGLRDFWGYAKKSSNFNWQTNSEVVISLGIKYKPLSDPPSPPPSLNCEWGPWELSLLVH